MAGGSALQVESILGGPTLWRLCFSQRAGRSHDSVPFRNPFSTRDLSLLLTNIPDLWYRCVCYLEQTSLGSLLRLPLSPLLPSFRLRTLFLSLRSFSRPDPLFSTTSTLFLQNTRGGIPLRDLVRCTEAPKCLFVSPLLATLTHCLSRKSFPCHSYANTRDGDATLAPVSPSEFLYLCGNADFARPLFSYSYELLFPQALYFDNHPHCPGVWGYQPPKSTPHLRTRRRAGTAPSRRAC